MAQRRGGEPAERRAAGKAAAFLAGGLLLALLLYHAGIGPVLVRLRALGWGAPLVLVPYLVIAAFDALGWRCTLPATARAPLGAVYLARMAGEALNSLTPTAVTGEPLKAHLLRAWGVSGADGVASIVIAKTALTVSQIFFILLGLAALFDRLDQEALGAAWLALLVVIAIVFSLTLVRLQRRGPALAVWRWLRRVVPRADFVARLEGGAQGIDARLADFYRIERGAFLRSTLWHLCGWLGGIFEVMLLMALIGTPIGLRDALLVEALAQPIRAVALVIPGGLGAQEVGGVALCRFLGIPEPAAVTLWLLKRARELAFDGVGLAYLARWTATRRARVEAG
jgi:putative membrane protein